MRAPARTAISGSAHAIKAVMPQRAPAITARCAPRVHQPRAIRIAAQNESAGVSASPGSSTISPRIAIGIIGAKSAAYQAPTAAVNPLHAANSGRCGVLSCRRPAIER
jgi:hypothetical protein